MISRASMLAETSREAQEHTILPVTVPSTAEYTVPDQNAAPPLLNGTRYEHTNRAELPETSAQEMSDNSPQELPVDAPRNMPAAYPPASELSAPGSSRPSLRATLNTVQDWKTGLHQLGE